MSVSAESFRVLSQVPGRIRLHLPDWKGNHADRIENCLRRIKGVQSVQANPLTGNVLVHFDHRTTDADTLLAKVNEGLEELSREESAPLERSGPHQPAGVNGSLLRVGVRGFLAHAVVDSLWFGAGFLGSAMGLPLAGLGPLHVLMDITIWTMAFSGEHKVHPPRTSSVNPLTVLASEEGDRILSGCTT